MSLYICFLLLMLLTPSPFVSTSKKKKNDPFSSLMHVFHELSFPFSSSPPLPAYFTATLTKRNASLPPALFFLLFQTSPSQLTHPITQPFFVGGKCRWMCICVSVCVSDVLFITVYYQRRRRWLRLQSLHSSVHTRRGKKLT